MMTTTRTSKSTLATSTTQSSENMLNQIKDIPRTRRRPTMMATRNSDTIKSSSLSSWSSSSIQTCCLITNTRITTHKHHHHRQYYMKLGLLLIICPIVLLLSGGLAITKSHGSHQLLAAASSSASNISPLQSVLLDTTEQSSLGWTKYPDGGPSTRTPGWVEESFTNFERGINWRSFVVCDVAFNSVNNWLWTPYLERGDANRLYIEIKFTMRDCNLFPQMVLSCKETFALLYKEVDGPIQASSSTNNNTSATSTEDYLMIDAIAADEGRFTSANDVVINTEVRSIPVSKRGVYFAFRDQGACLSLISIKVYSLSCPSLPPPAPVGAGPATTTTGSLARFNATPTGRDPTSLVPVEGECVANSIQLEPPRMFCGADGRWNSMSSGQCKCLPGYEPSANLTRCSACPVGRFKWQTGDAACQPCPPGSTSTALATGSTECRCHEGTFRPSSAGGVCLLPPGPPQNLTAAYVDATSVVLQWQPPPVNGALTPATTNRHHQQQQQPTDLITYRLICDQCEQTSTPTGLVSSPQFLANFSETKCVLSGLAPSTQYRFLVYAMNSLTAPAAGATAPTATAASPAAGQFSEIIIQTSRPASQTASNTLSAQNGFQLLPIFNFRALPGARGTDMILTWDSSASSSLDLLGQPSTSAGASSDADLLPSLYEVRFQPRYPPNANNNNQLMMSRRSPYSPLFTPPTATSAPVAPISGAELPIYQSVTTTNRALAINNILQPRTEYSFQVRAKWLHSSQWTDWSEPIYQSTSSGLPPTNYNNNFNPMTAHLDLTGGPPFNPFDPMNPPPYLQQQQQQQQPPPPGTTGWLRTLLMGVFCSLCLVVVAGVALLYLRRSPTGSCLQSLAGFGQLGSGSGHSSSTYAGVYNGGTSSDLIGVGGLHSAANLSSVINNLASSQGSGQTTASTGGGGGAGSGSGASSGSPSNLSHHLYHNGATLHHHHQQQHHFQPHLLANSTTGRSSATGNVVQNFIAATLNQISGHNHHHNHLANKQQAAEGKFFGSANNHQQQQLEAGNATTTGQLRNHYHQMLGNVNHTLLFNHHNQQHHNFQPPTLPIVPPASGQQLVGVANAGIYGPASGAAGDLFAALQQDQQHQHQQQHIHHQHQQHQLNHSSNQPMTKPYATRTLTTINRQGQLYATTDEPQMHIYDDLDVTACSPQSIQQQQQQQQQRFYYSPATTNNTTSSAGVGQNNCPNSVDQKELLDPAGRLSIS